jgi:hypothetical protein
MLAMAAFVICALSGIALIPIFKAHAPLDSLVLLSLKNPSGLLVRSVHYWSAQGFLVLTLAHIADHFLRRSETSVRFGIWVRLVLVIPVVVAAMLSGFLLRGDSAAVQALQVLRALLGFIPILGAALPRLLTGSGTDLTAIYLHHASTATLVIWLVTIEHARRIMPSLRAVWWTLPPVVLLSLLLVPGLEWRGEAVEKGPWYLVGLQEALHWLARPQWVVWFTLAVLACLVLLPRLSPRPGSIIRWSVGGTAVAYAALTLVGLAFRGDGWQWTRPGRSLRQDAGYLSLRAYSSPDLALVRTTVPMVSGRREGCLACHQHMAGFVAAHDPAAIGCAACHLGNPWTLNKSLAHAGMTLTPGNLAIVAQTCGASNCHSDVANRVRHSLMNTMSGVVAVDKYVFGESRDLDAHYDVAVLKHSPADSHLRQLCASCHLGQEKLQPGPINDTDRGGGCSACHLEYEPAALAELNHRGGGQELLDHPGISVHVSSQACFGCHSRSGRIATNYEGWHETLLDEGSAKRSPGWPGQFRQLADGRIFRKHPADVHAENGMTCVDCHVAREIMGDGSAHAHESDAIRIACIDCHQRGATVSRNFTQLDPETQAIIAMRKLNDPGRRYVVTSSGVAYENVFLDGKGRPMIAMMDSAKLLKPKPLAAACAASMHKRLTCAACHTAWAPQCIQCHTTFDRKAQGWDHLAGKFVNGAWQEQAEDYLGDAPALGVEQVQLADGAREERITTFAPGMILNLEVPGRGSTGSPRFRRLFAPVSAHTIATKGRDCRSCHANPAALGYGRGQLKYAVSGPTASWQFTPAYSRRHEDGLPADAWIGFLAGPKPDTTTRTTARPFNLEEQKTILLVGACLQCHNEADRRLAAAFADFAHYPKYLSKHCRVPDWMETSSHQSGGVS